MCQNLFTEDELLDLMYEKEPGLRQYLYHCGIRPEDMDEIMQDIMITVWRKANTLQNRAAFTSWLRKIAQRRAIRYHRVRERRWRFGYSLSQYEEEREEAGLPLPDGLIYSDPENFSNSEVYQMVMDLGPPASNILMLHYVYQEQFDEIAATLHMNPSTVRSIARRSLQKLKTRMTERGPQSDGKK